MRNIYRLSEPFIGSMISFKVAVELTTLGIHPNPLQLRFEGEVLYHDHICPGDQTNSNIQYFLATDHPACKQDNTIQKEALVRQCIPEISAAMVGIIRRSTNSKFQQQSLSLLNIESLDDIQQKIEFAMNHIVLASSKNTSHPNQGPLESSEIVIEK
ncbi:hypothetical protein HMI54_009397 [Coelomomyces lativittatus]|nr:hypothetical protein HMI54_009397 [Coelomomyces lativittatus]